ncbi:MAG: hypothetical protein R2792_14400 [Saprospiraceae bacterium]
MIRVYIDTNTYSFIKNAKSDFYVRLGSDLEKYKDRFIYYFSHAHLLDLKRDKSDKKEEDLNFMEQFVESNYLALGWKEKFVNVQIATPKEAFDGIDDEKPLADYFNFEEMFGDDIIDNSPEIKQAKSKLKELMSMPLNLGLATNISQHSEEDKKAWENLIPNIKDEYTFEEWLHQFSKMYDNLFNNPSTYKELRRFSIEKLSLTQKYNIDIEKIDFNEELKNTPLQLSFIEFVNKSLEHSKNTEQRQHEFFITAFNSLNILGLDKEKNKKAKFANTFHDGLHSFYSAHCDYLVSDDNGFLLKSKVLFKLLGIDTKVIHVEDFAQQIASIAGFLDETPDSYLKLLEYDIAHGLVINTKPSFRYNRTYTTIKPSQPHFAYFNQFDSIQDEIDGNILVFYRRINNYSKFDSYKEFEGVTNKIVKIFGIDNNLRGNYTQKDTEEIQNGDWLGRLWKIGRVNFHLEINEGTGRFNFAIVVSHSSNK